MLEVVDTQERLEEIRFAWDALVKRSYSSLLDHNWIASSAKAFSAIATPAIYLLWQGDQIRAAAPLGLFREGLNYRLRFIGYLLREPNGLLFSDEGALQELVTHLFNQGRPLALARLPSGAAEEKVLRATCPRSSLMIRAKGGFTHTARLPSSVDALETEMSANVRSTLRRKLKRARKLGEVTFTVQSPDAENVGGLIDELIRIEGGGWKGRRGTAIACDATLRVFYHEFSARAAANGRLRIYRMAIDGATIAIRLGVVADNALYELKIAFDEQFRELSPGLLLTHETLKLEIAEGLTRHEFLGMAEDWQKHWPLERKEQASFRSYPLDMRGAMAIGHDVYDKVRRRYSAAVTTAIDRN
ncbi:GNAT family N-acetyltransferase [Pseudorhizobium flavum]|uniref:CelD/BcsL family acetyltransferase involved in cellulose biosynthesis n=1 Tax=Pseudorhizobium flavum TaxID=1335061 RepID=A0A7X0DF08_9HYPH|nr:GNAT family N-acetyltransferase [Pseudorhizobium flavum]MBB6182345.1 CelD/BcsL family acetyltransferase involved in cellulose biosynthesis [Pseudorhizobium flavum]CAD6632041.1 GNAT family N-acetyltransferase [Pseudorhizobium flavum]